MTLSRSFRLLPYLVAVLVATIVWTGEAAVAALIAAVLIDAVLLRWVEVARCYWCSVRLRAWQFDACRLCGPDRPSPPCKYRSRAGHDPDRLRDVFRWR